MVSRCLVVYSHLVIFPLLSPKLYTNFLDGVTREGAESGGRSKQVVCIAYGKGRKRLKRREKKEQK